LCTSWCLPFIYQYYEEEKEEEEEVEEEEEEEEGEAERRAISTLTRREGQSLHGGKLKVGWYMSGNLEG